MKKIIFILICWVVFQSVSAQENQQSKANTQDELKTILGTNSGTQKIPIGYFIEIGGGYTQFGSNGVFLPGLSLGIILNHKWTIGLTGNFIDNARGLRFNNIYYDSTTRSMLGANLNGGFGGVLLEYTLFPKSKIHIAFPLMLGDGYLYYTKLPEYSGSAHPYRSRHHAYISKDNCFVIEPGVRLEFNLLKFLRLGLTLSYRYTPDFKLLNTSGDLVNQFTGKISLRFGQF
jgi:hypothetical protein